MAVGGLLGSVTSAFLTEYFGPKQCFAFSSMTGLLIAYTATKLDVSLETLGDEDEGKEQERNFWKDLNRNFS